MTRRKQILLGLSCATLLAVWFAPDETVMPAAALSASQSGVTIAAIDGNPVQAPASSTANSSASRTASASNRLLTGQTRQPLARQLLDSAPVDLFYLPETPEQNDLLTEFEQPAAPVAPKAPPLPYTYLGKMTQNGVLRVFLNRDNKSYVIQHGDVIDEVYHVDAINPPLLQLTYLPLKETQLMSIGTLE